MPSGRYELRRDDALVGTEDFRCAPGPIGWRYFSTVSAGGAVSRVDLSVDARWRPVRVRIETPDHHLIATQTRGGFTVLLDEERFELGEATVAAYPSPAFLVAATHALSCGGDVDALAIDPATLHPSFQRLRFEPMAPEEDVETPAGTFAAARWRTGSREFWVAGDVVVAAAGLGLMSYDPGAQGPRPRPG